MSGFGKKRTKYSFFNALSAMLVMFVNGFFSIIVTRLVIFKFGSDFNGLNSTANQIISVLLILEGGFTLASNVALFSPISKRQYELANSILSATKCKFRKIGIYFLLLGCAIAVLYSFIVKTLLARELVLLVIIMAVVPQAFNLLFVATYRVLLQVQQKEYIINCFTALTIGLGHITNILVILYDGKMWMVRFVTMLFALINCFLIVYYVRKYNSFIDFSVKPNPNLIKGTNDVLVQKITGVIYNSWPIVYLSIALSGGTMVASVYSVYNNVFILVKGVLRSIIDAPRLSFGQMLSEMDKDDIWVAFKKYELVVITFVFIVLTTVSGLVMSFITLYTFNVTDINYYDVTIATLMIFIGLFEIIHIPSGHIINMSGNFKTAKNFQILACAVLIITMALLGNLYGIYGMLESLLLVAVLLAILEIGFVHYVFFNNRIREWLRMVSPFIFIGVILSYYEMMIVNANNYIELIYKGLLMLTGNTIIALLIGYIFSRDEFLNIKSYGMLIIKNKLTD